MNHTEDRRVCPDSQTECEYCDQGKTRPFHQIPNRVFHTTLNCSLERRLPCKLMEKIRCQTANYPIFKKKDNWDTSMTQIENGRTQLGRREWLMIAGGALIASRVTAQSKLLPLNTSGLDHLSVTAPD